MYKWIDHIVVRVKDLDQSIEDYQSKLHMQVSEGPEEQPHLGLRRAVLPLGESGRFIELAEPLGDHSAIGRSIERLGEGVHLVAVAVENMQQAIAELKQQGTQLIEMGNQVFIHPRETHGVLYQLIERQ